MSRTPRLTYLLSPTARLTVCSFRCTFRHTAAYSSDQRDRRTRLRPSHIETGREPVGRRQEAITGRQDGLGQVGAGYVSSAVAYDVPSGDSQLGIKANP